jgi:hypothetical protein
MWFSDWVRLRLRLAFMDEELKSYLIVLSNQLGDLKVQVDALRVQHDETKRELREHTEAVRHGC